MKKVFLNLFVLTGLLLATSCSSDDDNDSSVELEGTWKLTAFNVGQSFDLNNDGTASANLLDEIDCYDNETLVFTDNGVVTYMSTSYADIEFVLGEGEQSTYMIQCEQEIENSPAAYVRNGNTVTITITDVEDGETFEEIIVATLDGDELSFVIPDGFEVEGDDFELVVEEDLTYVFTKQ